jgi:predicted MPP superfamily phosphohydrolase
MNSRRQLIMTLVLTGILSLFATYLGLRFTVWAYTLGFSPVIAWVALFGCVFLQGFGYYLISFFSIRHRMLSIITWITQILFGFFMCLLLFTVAVDLITVLLRFFLNDEQETKMEWITFFFVIGATSLAGIVGLIQARLIGPRIYRVDVPLAGLPEAFDGFKIAQISDLHIGPTIGPRLEEYRKIGLNPLLNEHVLLQEQQSSLVLAGITDYTAGGILPDHAYDIKKALHQAPAGAIQILLSHQPAPYEQISDAGVHLQISGHTHGGQFFPGSVFVKFAQKFLKGLYRHKNMWIYVSRGTGYWGPPLRFTVPSEITLLTLRQKFTS